MLIALSASLPRYAIERFGGPRDLGVFAAVASFITIGSVIVNSLGQSAMTRLAEQRRAIMPRSTVLPGGWWASLADSASSRSSARGCWDRGYCPFCIHLHMPAIDELLTAALAAGAVGWMAQILGFVTTSARAFRQQLILLVAVCCTTGAVSFAAVPAFGLYGAVLALGIAGVVGIGGQIFILQAGRVIAFVLLWLLVFAIPWEKSVVIPGVGTLTRLIGIAALLAALAEVAQFSAERAARGVSGVCRVVRLHLVLESRS